MRNVGSWWVYACVLSLAACKLPLKKKNEDASAKTSSTTSTTSPTTSPTPAATPTTATTSSARAKVSATEGYPTDGLRVIPADCVAPQVILTAIPRSVFDAPGFLWRFARQVALANQQFSFPLVEIPGSDRILFTNTVHLPTKGVALVAHCVDPRVCTQLAAAYRTVVPTSKPEVVCGKAPTLGEDIEGPNVLNYDASDITMTSLPTKDDVVGQCVRLAACQAERDRKLDGDPAIACQKKPTAFKLACAFKYPCSDVLDCVGR